MSERQPRARATIREVAAMAGVGIKTVSRVVNREPNVSAATQKKVLEAVAALNYKPNQGAGSLRRGDGKTLTLGLLLDAVDNPFSAAINRSVESVAWDRGTAVFAASIGNDPERERALVEAFTRRRVDGLILTTISGDHGYLQTERDQGVPIVFVDRPPLGVVADTVLTDNRRASARAVAHLLEHGHRVIGYLGDDLEVATARERQSGYHDAMTAAGVTVSPDLVRSGLTSAELAYAAARDLLRGPLRPTALYSSQNLVTIGTLRALHDLGLQHTVALVGFDDVFFADLLDPAVTVMAQDPAEMGRIAAERVFARLDGDEQEAFTSVVPAGLVVRGSGEIPPEPQSRRQR